MSSVTFDHVTKRFGDVTAVDDLSLDISDQEFMVLLGPSGCGKTTALRMIAGLESVTEGTLSIGDRTVNDVPARDRDIAMVFQSYALYPHMTVFKNIESPLIASRANRPPTDERNRRVREAADVLDLGDYLDRKPGELSGGQRQRVALARAIVRRPQVFLMDEPLSNLDAKLRTQTRLELVELWRRLSTTFVYVTHDQVEAMTMASRIAIIAEGRLHQVGAPQAVYERPANLFVAGFIGSPPMNMIEGQLTDPGTGRLVLRTPLGDVPLPPSAASAQQSAAVAGIRPEHLHVGGADLSVEVLNVEQLGHERHLVCGAGPVRWVVRQASSEPTPQVGEALGLGVDSQQVHLFDPTTTLRID